MIEPLVQVLYTQKPISNIKCFRNHQMNLYYDLYCPLQKKWRGWICIEHGTRKRFTDNSSIIEALIKSRSREKELCGIFPLDWASPPPIWNLTWDIWKVLSGSTTNQDLKVWGRVTFAFVEKWVCQQIHSPHTFYTFDKWLIFSETPKCAMQHVIGHPIYLRILNPEM